MYKVITPFEERYDGNRLYKKGDVWPREGFSPPDGRAEALASGEKGLMNRTGIVYLKPDGAPKEKKTAKKKPEKAED